MSSYEHPSHSADRAKRAVSPVLDLTGWDAKAKRLDSLEGQLSLPGFEGHERDRTWRKKRDEGRDQLHFWRR